MSGRKDSNNNPKPGSKIKSNSQQQQQEPEQIISVPGGTIVRRKDGGLAAGANKQQQQQKQQKQQKGKKENPKDKHVPTLITKGTDSNNNNNNLTFEKIQTIGTGVPSSTSDSLTLAMNYSGVSTGSTSTSTSSMQQQQQFQPQQQQQPVMPLNDNSQYPVVNRPHSNEDRIVTVGWDPVFHVIIDNLWGYEASQEILNHLDTLKDNFREAGVSANNTLLRSYRTNTSCYLDSLFPRWSFSGSWEQELQDWPGRKAARAIASPLLKRVDNLFENNDYMLNELLDHAPYPGCKYRAFDSWETQVSRYGGEPKTPDEEGQFYTWHHDRIDGDPRADGRLMSMVYYVHSFPRKFEGGNIALSNGLIHGGQIRSAGSKEIEIEPKNDRLVIFNSRTVHMVKPTKTPENTPFRDGRFSVNVWCGRMQYFIPGDLF